jgi:hypothetical protein
MDGNVTGIKNCRKIHIINISFLESQQTMSYVRCWIMTLEINDVPILFCKQNKEFSSSSPPKLVQIIKINRQTSCTFRFLNLNNKQFLRTVRIISCIYYPRLQLRSRNNRYRHSINYSKANNKRI